MKRRQQVARGKYVMHFSWRVTLNQNVVLMKLDAGSGHQKAVYRIAWPGKPQGTARYF
jgi:hypothetical protein